MVELSISRSFNGSDELIVAKNAAYNKILTLHLHGCSNNAAGTFHANSLLAHRPQTGAGWLGPSIGTGDGEKNGGGRELHFQIVVDISVARQDVAVLSSYVLLYKRSWKDSNTAMTNWRTHSLSCSLRLRSGVPIHG